MIKRNYSLFTRIFSGALLAVASYGLSWALSVETRDVASLSASGDSSGNRDSYTCCGFDVMTPDGRFVFFSSEASNLAVNDLNGADQDLFAHDFQTGTTLVVSMNSAGTGTGNGEAFQPAITPDGRFVAFASEATNFVLNGPADTNHVRDVFLRDMQMGLTYPVSVNALGTDTPNNHSNWPKISADGRYVLFASYGTNLVLTNDTNQAVDVFVRDMQTGTTKLVSINAAGTGTGNFGADDSSYRLSADGRYVFFTSSSSDLVSNDTNGTISDIFVRDLQTSTTTLVSINLSGTGSGNNSSGGPAVTPDGRYVAFTSQASNLVGNDTNNFISDVFLRDMQTGTTVLVSANWAGTGSGNAGANSYPSITPDGRYVAFASFANDLVTNDSNGAMDVFVRDIQSGTTTLVSVNIAGQSSAGTSAIERSHVISADGRYVVFDSYASDLVAIDTGGQRNIFVRDLAAGVTRLVSMNVAGDGGGNDESNFPVISDDGAYVAFPSMATNLTSTASGGHYFNIYRVKLTDVADGDANHDGIADNIETLPGSFADTNVPPTTGAIVDTNGLAINISDSADTAEGVRITVGTGSGAATFLVCGFSLSVSADSTAIATCGSLTVKVIAGAARIALDQNAGTVDIAAGSTVKVSEESGGTFLVVNLNGDGITVTTGDGTIAIPSGSEVKVGARFEGFFQPVENNGVLNKGRAGSAVPLKWRLTRPDGSPITDLTAVSLSVGLRSCSAGAVTHDLEETSSVGSGLQNLGNGFYQINWKTSKSYAGSCRELHLALNPWGIEHTAMFRFVN